MSAWRSKEGSSKRAIGERKTPKQRQEEDINSLYETKDYCLPDSQDSDDDLKTDYDAVKKDDQTEEEDDTQTGQRA